MVETEMDRLVAAATARLAPRYAAIRATKHEVVLPPMAEIEVTAMHGGAGRGERFIPPKRRR